METRMRHLWANVLTIDSASVGPKDNFLWLGGDSVSAIGLVALARTVKLHLNVQTIFKHPILSEMSQETTSLDSSTSEIPEIAPFALVTDFLTIQDLKNEASVQCNVQMDLVEDIYPCTEMQRSLLALS